MNTDHTRRNGLRAGALTVLFTAVLFGAPATALASPTDTPAAPCLSCKPLPPADHAPPAPGPTPKVGSATPGPTPTVAMPELTYSNSGERAKPGQPAPVLWIYGDQFTHGGRVHIEVWIGGLSVPYWQGDVTAYNTGGDVNVYTTRNTDCGGGIDGYAVAVDQTTGRRSNQLPVAACQDLS
jgi:hypothetical protein